MTVPARPALTSDLSGTELLRWYWLKDELTDFARALGLRTTGGKDTVTARIVAFLDHLPFTEPEPKRNSGAKQLAGVLTGSIRIPRGQRCSQVVRAWFVEQVGQQFAFDAEMRSFFASTDGTQTLDDSLDHYRATREQGPKAIEVQFEYNRFTRAWHQANPVSSRDELLRAWQDYRRRPVDQRGRI